MLTYVKESWQYILGRAELDFDGYAIEVLVFCVGFALMLNVLPVDRASSPLPTALVDTSRVVSRAIFLPTLKFESARLVAAGGIEISPGVAVVRTSVEFTDEQRTKIEAFADKLIRCANAEDSREPMEVEIIGFASDAGFYDPGATRARDDSGTLNVLVANRRTQSTQRELDRALKTHPQVGMRSIKVDPVLWATSGDAGLQDMLRERQKMSDYLAQFFNASMDDRAAVIMNKGRVCRAQFYRPGAEMMPDAR